MAQNQPASPVANPVKLEDFVADREGFADGVWGASKIAIGAIIALLVLMAIFLV
jgi:hypothetical protein